MNISTDTHPARGTLMLHLLGRCNLRCLHCYMEGAPTRREKLPADLVLSALRECSTLGIGAIFLTGGEPLLYPELPDVLQAAHAVAGAEVTLCTNATLLQEHHIALVRDLGTRVNISVDGPAKFHDYFRQQAGAFRRTERSVRRLVDAGVPVTIVTTISQSNMQDLPTLVAWAAAAGAQRFRMQPLLRLGRGEGIADQRLTDEQMNQLILQLSDLANQYRGRLDVSLVGVTRRFLLAHPCGAYVCNGLGCHRRVQQEIKKLVVREDGSVLPEVTNLHASYALGHMQDAPLSSLVTRYFDEGGYARFDELCRTAYAEILPTWQSAVVPWDQIVAERSRMPHPAPAELHFAGCGDPAHLTSACTPVPA